MNDVVRVGKMSGGTLLIKLIVDLLLCFVLIGFVLFPRDLVIFFKNRLIIRSKRITGHKGLLNTTQLDCSLSKITGIQVEQGLFGKMFNYGTVCVSTASVLLKFEYIESPNEFRDALNNQIEIYEETSGSTKKLMHFKVQ